MAPFLIALVVTAVILGLADSFAPTNRLQRRHASIITIESSALEDLEIIDIKEGTGEVAKFESIVTVKYVGKFYETQETFDESMISFKLGYGKVIKGCDQGIRGMKVGGNRILKIPASLGFGAEGFGPEPYSIPPNTDLEYSVELTNVSSGPMAEAAASMGIGLDRNTVYLK